MSYSALLGTTGVLDQDTDGGAGQSGIALGTGTGQQGHAQVDQSNTNPFVALWHWLHTPFATPMSPANVFLLIGVVIIGVIAWNMILYHIRVAAEAI